MPSFSQLNAGWNANPNAPEPEALVTGEKTVTLRFCLNRFTFDDVSPDEIGVVMFENASKWRFDPTNDEAWFSGEGRYSRVAPAWGEFYEISGLDPDANAPTDWHSVDGDGERHFLFYFRDEVFECFASDWSFQKMAKGDLPVN